MTYTVRILPKVRKNLSKLPQKNRAKIELALLMLAKDPYLGSKLHGDLRDSYKLKVWPYRIVYRIYQQQLIIVVIEIAHRQGVYK